MSTEHAWSPGQRALLRFLEREGLVSALPAADGTPSDERLFGLIAELVDPSVVAATMAARLRLPLLGGADDVDPAAAALVAAPVAVRCGAAPVALQGQTLEVATANPLDLDMVKTLEFASGRRVRVRVATPEMVRHALARLYGDEAVPAPNVPMHAEPVAAGAADEQAFCEPPAVAAEPAVPACETMPAPVSLPDPLPEPAAVSAASIAPTGDGDPIEPDGAVAAAPPVPRVLVVAHDAATRQTLAEALRAGDAPWLVMTAGDLEEAALVLAVTSVDLVVADAPLPSDGFGLSVSGLPVLLASVADADLVVRARAVLDSLGTR